MRKKVGLVLNILFILLLLAVVFSYAMFQGGFVSWFLFYSFLPILLYLLIFLLYPVSNWEVHRKTGKTSLEASGKAEIEITIERKFPFPIYYCVVEEVMPASLHFQDTKRDKYLHMENEGVLAQQRMVQKTFSPWFRRSFSTSYQLELLPRGEHRLEAIQIKCGDFFGFIKKEHTFQVKDRLLVYPAKREMKVSEKTSSMDGGSSATFNMQTKSSNVVTGVRDYAPGDRFSWIDWKSTARRNTVMTKEFEQEKSTNVLLVLDSVSYPEINKIAFEGSVELTASLIESLRKSNIPFSFLSLGKSKKMHPFQADEAKRRAILQHLAQINPSVAEPFASQFKSELGKLPSGNIVMAITTRLDADLKQAIDRVKKKSKRVVLFVVQAKNSISKEEKNVLKELNVNGVVVNLVTEEKLVQKKFEVNT